MLQDLKSVYHKLYVVHSFLHYLKLEEWVSEIVQLVKRTKQNMKKNEISLEWPSLPFFDFKMLHTYSFETIEQ